MATYDAVEVLGRVSHELEHFTMKLNLLLRNLSCCFQQLVNEFLANNIFLSGTALARAAIGRTFDLDTGNIEIDKFGERLLNHCVSDFNVSTKQFEVSASISV